MALKYASYASTLFSWRQFLIDFWNTIRVNRGVRVDFSVSPSYLSFDRVTIRWESQGVFLCLIVGLERFPKLLNARGMILINPISVAEKIKLIGIGKGVQKQDIRVAEQPMISRKLPGPDFIVKAPALSQGITIISEEVKLSTPNPPAIGRINFFQMKFRKKSISKPTFHSVVEFINPVFSKRT